MEKLLRQILKEKELEQEQIKLIVQMVLLRKSELEIILEEKTKRLKEKSDTKIAQLQKKIDEEKSRLSEKVEQEQENILHKEIDSHMKYLGIATKSNVQMGIDKAEKELAESTKPDKQEENYVAEKEQDSYNYNR